MATVKSKCKDLGILKDILKDLGFEMTEEKTKTTVKAMDGVTAEVISKAKGQDFGIQEIEGQGGEKEYQLAGEFYRTKWYGQEKALSDKINRNYAGRKARKELEALGYFVSENAELKESADGSISMTMTRY